jgi:hypothetical protein
MSRPSADTFVAGPVLGFVGGLVVLIYGAYEAYLGSTLQKIPNLGGIPVGSPSSATFLGALGIFFGLAITVSASMVELLPPQHELLGGLVILFALVSLVSVGGGNGVGFVLAVLGGTACIVFGPPESDRFFPGGSVPDVPAPNGPPSDEGTARPRDSTHLVACPFCARMIPVEARTCPHCSRFVGNRLPR